MPIYIICLVLLAALLHASWNAVVRGSGDKLLSATLICIFMGLFALLFLPFFPLPSRTGWICAIASASIHVVYNIMLARSYGQGDLSLVYPIARGSSPLLVSLGGAIVASEKISLLALSGLLLISTGILAAALDGRMRRLKTLLSVLPNALGTGVTIAAYTVVDGIGARASTSALGYAAWMFVLTGLVMPCVYLLLPGRGPFRFRNIAIWKPALGGVAGVLAYSIVIFAIRGAPMGPVSALRETSIVFAILIGRIFLCEAVSRQRVVACLMIVSGTLLIA